MKIVEKRYRGSVICRLMGYPITYGIVKMLLEKNTMGLEEIVKYSKRSKSTVCFHLSKLKLANIIRYEKRQHRTIYWIKYPTEIHHFLAACETLVKRTISRIDKDF